jgi:hypothetical protein
MDDRKVEGGDMVLLLHSRQKDQQWCNKRHIHDLEELKPRLFPHMNSNTFANQRRFTVREEKLSGIEHEQVQADDHRMTGITTAPYEQNTKPCQQTDEH